MKDVKPISVEWMARMQMDRYKVLNGLIWFACMLYVSLQAGAPLRYGLFELSIWWMLVFVIWLVVYRRTLAVLLATGLFGLFHLISSMKQNYLGQKVYFDDLKMLGDTWSILINFMDVRLWGILFLMCVLIWVFVLLERPVGVGWIGFGVLVLALGVSINFLKTDRYVWHYNDIKGRHGVSIFVGSGFYPRRLSVPSPEHESVICCAKYNPQAMQAIKQPAEMPHVVAVLLESQIDLQKIIGTKIDTGWERFNPGALQVYARGGGTWIQEYALLHGVSPLLYGENFGSIHRLGPGVLDGRLAPFLKSQGYTTTSIVPYERDLYGTDVFHSSLGVDVVVDCEDAGLCAVGERKVDRAVFEGAVARLREAQQPEFLFLLTMLQHSPHKLVSGPRRFACDTFGVLSQVCDELNEFHHREAWMQEQILRFVDQINDLPRRTVVVFFGDHIPAFLADDSLRSAFIGDSDQRTLAFVYDNKSRRFQSPADALFGRGDAFVLASEDLDMLLLHQAGFESAYVAAKKQRYLNNQTQDKGKL